MKINCIVVDDEPLARKGLAEYISEVEFLELKAVCENSIAANKVLNEQAIDLMFLDIQMPKMTGLDFLKSLHQKPLVILTTAYSEYALKGYELDVLDYLLKPISLERFLKAANKAKEFHALKQAKNTDAEKPANYFFVRCNNQYEKIMFDELLFAQAMENYVVLQTTSQKFISYITLKGVEEYLPAADFIKVHKSFIISIPKIDKITASEIIIGPHSIPISRNMKEEIMEKIVNNKLLKR